MGVALRDILVDYRTPVDWESLRGAAGIDAYNALYQFLTIIRQPDGTPLMDREGRITSHLSGIFFRMINFLEKGIRPVYIFDGEPPEFKTETIEERRSTRKEAGRRFEEALRAGDTEEAYRQARSAAKIDEHVIATAKDLLSHMGIPWVDAPSEGEAQAAAMVREGRVQYAVSQDYDSLLFGAPILVRNLTVSGRRKVHGRSVTVRPERLVLQEILDGLALSREQLIEIGLLIGTDFNAGIRGVGPKTALKIVREGKFRATFEEKQPGYDPEPVLEFFLEPPTAKDYEIHWHPPDRDRIVEMLCGGYDFSEERVLTALERLGYREGQRTLDHWF
jgi:flap endonuclease-1